MVRSPALAQTASRRVAVRRAIRAIALSEMIIALTVRRTVLTARSVSIAMSAAILAARSSVVVTSSPVQSRAVVASRVAASPIVQAMASVHTPSMRQSRWARFA